MNTRRLAFFIRRDCRVAVAVKCAPGAAKYMREEHLEAKYPNAASGGGDFPSYDVNNGFEVTTSQQVP